MADLLASVSGRMEPREAARICGEAARALADALARKEDADARPSLAEGLVAVTNRMEPREAARTLANALAEEPNAHASSTLAVGLAAVSARMEPAEAARVCSQSAGFLARAMRKVSHMYDRCYLAEGLSAVSAKLEPHEAALICRPAAQLFSEAMEREENSDPYWEFGKELVALTKRLPPTDGAQILLATLNFERVVYAGDRESLAKGLSAAAAYMEPAEAARVLSEAARTLTDALAKAPDAQSRLQLAGGLAAVAGRFEPREAARICGEAIRLLRQARAEEAASDFRRTEPVTTDEALLLDGIDPDRARGLACELASSLCAENDNSDEDATTLNLLLSDASREQWRRRMAAAWAAGAVDEEWARMILEGPWPCRLTTQELVELLKMPTCLGGVRRVVLEHLGNRYGRKFTNHWEFVRFAESRRLGLDFKSPTKRPRPAALGR